MITLDAAILDPQKTDVGSERKRSLPAVVLSADIGGGGCGGSSAPTATPFEGDGLPKATNQGEEVLSPDDDYLVSEFYVQASASALPMNHQAWLSDRYTVTLATHLSVDRFDRLVRLSREWGGLVSATVLIRNKADEEDADRTQGRGGVGDGGGGGGRYDGESSKLFSGSPSLPPSRSNLGDIEGVAERAKTLGNVDLHLLIEKNGTLPYPNNVLRQVSARCARTELVFNLDVDFHVSKNLSGVLADFARKLFWRSGQGKAAAQHHHHHHQQQRQIAVVVPAFEVDPSLPINNFPSTRDEALALLRSVPTTTAARISSRVIREEGDVVGGGGGGSEKGKEAAAAANDGNPRNDKDDARGEEKDEEVLDDNVPPQQQQHQQQRQSLLRQFHVEHWAPGHNATNYARWEAAKRPYAVKYQPFYEPYLLLAKPFPSFDPRFHSGYFDKDSHVLELALARYRFVVVLDGFVVHEAHDNERRSAETKAVIARHYVRYKAFKRDIEAVYRDRAASKGSEEETKKHNDNSEEELENKSTLRELRLRRRRRRHRLLPGGVVHVGRPSGPPSNLLSNPSFDHRRNNKSQPGTENEGVGGVVAGWHALPCPYEVVRSHSHSASSPSSSSVLKAPRASAYPVVGQPCGASQLVDLSHASGRKRGADDKHGPGDGDRHLRGVGVFQSRPVALLLSFSAKKVVHSAAVAAAPAREKEAEDAITPSIVVKGRGAGLASKNNSSLMIASDGADGAVRPPPKRRQICYVYVDMQFDDRSYSPPVIKKVARAPSGARGADQQWVRAHHLLPVPAGRRLRSAFLSVVAEGFGVSGGGGGHGEEDEKGRGEKGFVTHLTVDRLPALQTVCEYWRGPISATLYSPSPSRLVADLQKVGAALTTCLNRPYKRRDRHQRADGERGGGRGGCTCLRDHARIHIVSAAGAGSGSAEREREREEGEEYPINYLRNIALKAAVAGTPVSHVLLCDVDLVPVVGSHAPDILHLLATTREGGERGATGPPPPPRPPAAAAAAAAMKEEDRTAFVLPAFQLHSREESLPESKSELLGMLRSKHHGHLTAFDFSSKIGKR
eukprot:jgi/Bigna1/141103/aug1.60_g15811